MVALVRGVHGLRGAVRVEVLTDRPENRFVPGTVLFPEGRDEPLTIAAAEAVADGPGWRIRFREIGSRDAADRLRGAYLEAAVVPELELGRGEYYWHEVIGVTVRGVDGTDLGTVRDIYRIGENEVFSVEGGPFGAFDLPAVRAFVRVFAPRRARSWWTPSRSTCGRRASAVPDPDRPKAPRRLTRRPKNATAAAAPEPPEPSPTEPRPPLPSRPRRPSHDPRDRHPDALPGDARGAAQSAASRRASRSRGWPRSGSGTCATGAWVGTGRSTTPRTAGERGWCCDPSRSPRPSTSSVARTRPRSSSTRRARCFDQARAAELAEHPHLIFLCARYEGVDERIRSLVDLELSIGDYVLTGGELPALVVIDAVLRLLPGAIDAASTSEESFSAGLLEYPQYTRPPTFRGMDVPAILTSGDHGAVARWRDEQARARTRERRPDLLDD